jgi:hypothetical protein
MCGPDHRRLLVLNSRGRGEMDIEAIIDAKIKPQLIEAFGRQTTDSLLTQATLAYVSADGSEQERFEVFVQTICALPHGARGGPPSGWKTGIWSCRTHYSQAKLGKESV